jgi:hypothetical protein
MKSPVSSIAVCNYFIIMQEMRLLILWLCSFLQAMWFDDCAACGAGDANKKFGLSLELKNALVGRQIWLAASTHVEEEEGWSTLSFLFPLKLFHCRSSFSLFVVFLVVSEWYGLEAAGSVLYL